ncbi:MAG: hypothetical protein IPN26_12460 [Bacteroidetes bacterium]|nr:hypothetical protein [Bacteroidota bacterium]
MFILIHGNTFHEIGQFMLDKTIQETSCFENFTEECFSLGRTERSLDAEIVLG